jgi:hypothetical protein
MRSGSQRNGTHPVRYQLMVHLWPIPTRLRRSSLRSIAVESSAAGGPCAQALALGFGTTSSNRLEQILNPERIHASSDGLPVWTGKYRQWRRGKIPSEASVALALARSDGRVDLRYWRDLPLWDLLAEPFDLAPLNLHDLLTQLAPPVRAILFFSPEPDECGEWARLGLRDADIAALRALGTLDAFVALLTLARSAQLAHNDQQHAVLTASAFAILANVLNRHPQLEACMDHLFACLTFSFWSAWYLGGIRQELNKETLWTHLQALRTDARAVCRVPIGCLEGEPEKEPGVRLADYFSSVLGLRGARGK